MSNSSTSLARASQSPRPDRASGAAVSWPADGGQEDSAWPQPLSRQQVAALGLSRPLVSPWQVLIWQAATGVLVALLLALISGQSAWGWSALYGAAAVVLPATVFARGLMGRLASIHAASAAMGFLTWEMVKLGLSLAMLLSAPALVKDLNWPALLAGLVLTMKVVWLSVWMQSRRPRTA